MIWLLKMDSRSALHGEIDVFADFNRKVFISKHGGLN